MAGQFTWMYLAQHVNSPGCCGRGSSIHLDVAGKACQFTSMQQAQQVNSPGCSGRSM
jgi:hypothetical protein